MVQACIIATPSKTAVAVLVSMAITVLLVRKGNNRGYKNIGIGQWLACHCLWMKQKSSIKLKLSLWWPLGNVFWPTRQVKYFCYVCPWWVLLAWLPVIMWPWTQASLSRIYYHYQYWKPTAVGLLPGFTHRLSICGWTLQPASYSIVSSLHGPFDSNPWTHIWFSTNIAQKQFHCYLLAWCFD